MAASVTDKFRKASGSGRPVVTSLSLPKAAGATTCTLTSATGWNTDTGLDYVMYRRELNTTTGLYQEVTGTRIEGRATLSGTTLSGMTIDAGTEPAAGYAADGNTVVLAASTAKHMDDMVDGLITTVFDQDGTLKAGAVDNTAVIADGVVTNAKLATGIAANKLSNPYKFSVYASATVAISTTAQKVALNTENFDTNNNFDSTTNYRYTVPVTGFYQINAQIAVASSGMGTTEVATAALYKNGAAVRYSQQIEGTGTNARLPRLPVVTLLQLTAGDYLEMYAVMGGVYRDIVGGASVTFMEGFLVSAT